MKLISNPVVRRCAPRLLRFAHGLGTPISSLTLEHFGGEVYHSATGYEVLNILDRSRFCRLRKWKDYPRDRFGLMRWTRLRPKDLKAAAELNKIVLERQERPRAIKFRFLLRTNDHAHVGVFVFGGKVVERLLREARRLRGRPR